MGNRIAANFANILATVALIAALGGSAYAAAQLGKDSVGARQIKNGAVRSAEVKNGSLSGKDIGESGLGQVPEAAHAAQADDATTLQGEAPGAFLGATATAANADQLDGIDSNGFLAANGKAANADKLDGIDSTGFLAANGKAVNADKLDGIDSTGFTQGNNSSVLAATSDPGPNTFDSSFIQADNLNIDINCQASPASNPLQVFAWNPNATGTAEITIFQGASTAHYTKSNQAVAEVDLAAAGDSAVIQVAKAGTVSTVWITDYNDANGCHAAANGLTVH